MKIGIKLTISFFFVAAISMLVIGIISFNKAKKSLTQEHFNKLVAIKDVKEDQIEDYFTIMNHQVVLFAEDPTVIRAVKKFSAGFDSIAIHLNIDENKMEAINLSVDDFLKKEYLPRLNSNLDAPATFESENNTSQKGKILQALYIATNSNAIGEKSSLDDAGDSSSYSKAHKRFHPIFRKFKEKFRFHDILLVNCQTGIVLYSCEKELDYGTSLLDGPFKSTNVARAFQAAKNTPLRDSVCFEDFETYHPSFNAPEAFISCPIFDGEKRIGVVIFAVPIDEINDIVTNDRNWEEIGLMGKGEAYIVGADFKMRSQARGLIDDTLNYLQKLKENGIPEKTIRKIQNLNTSVSLLEIKTDGVMAALKGEDSAGIIMGHLGIPVLSAYGPLESEGMNWAILSELDETEAFENIDALRNQMTIAFIILLVIIAIFSIFLSRKITQPIELLSGDAMELAKGNFDIEIKTERKDEIGILASSFRKMQISLRNMVKELRDVNQHLEQKVIERTVEVTHQKQVLEIQNKEILDSINYALRLQKAILPPHVNIDAALKESFVLFKPKDIVSGDFYWISHLKDEVLIAAVDCTGHGVPGALVSMIGSNNLDRCIGEFGLRKPSDILDKLKELVVATFDSTHDDEVKDGMDIALISLRYISEVGETQSKTGIVNYSGANNPLWVIKKDAKEPAPGEEGAIFEIKADKQPIGRFEYGKPFTNHEVNVHVGDCIYLFTDGYADQFGGPQGKKFRYKSMKNLLLKIHNLPMAEQRNILDNTFEQWRGELGQIDDVCVIGIRV